MLGILIGLIGIAAVGAWLVALMSALQVVALVPSGQRLKSWFALGAWRFAEIIEAGGPAVEPHLKRYRYAFFAFFAVVIAAAVLGVLLGAEQQNNTHEDSAVLATHSTVVES